MKKIIFIIPFIIFLISLVAFFYLLNSNRNPRQIPSALIDKDVPNFITTSLFEKSEFSSKEEFNNETIVINFFATWCKPCKAEHEYIKKIADKKIKVIGINYKDDTQLAIRWLNELGNPYSKVAIDTNGQIAIEWGVYGIPETFIVNSNNKIFYRHVGPITKNEFNNFILKIYESEKNHDS